MGRISRRIEPIELIELKKVKRRIARIPADGRWVAVIRIRGTVNVRRDVEDTLRMLRLHKPHHAVIIPLTESYKGMLMKVQKMIAWGEVNFDTFLKLLKNKGRLIGDKKLTDALVRDHSKGRFGSIEDLARSIWSKEIDFKNLPWLKPVFRLRPPSGGYRGSVKKPFELGGSFGYWGSRINELLEKMM